MPTTTNATGLYELKSCSPLLTKIAIKNSNLSLLRDQLADQYSKTPNFFTGINVIVDISALDTISNDDFTTLTDILTSNKMNIVGVHPGTNIAHHQLAKQLKLPTFANTNSKDSNQNMTNVTRPSINIISTPVRSGQQIYARNGDLVILNSVSTGAEVMADGNIHIYGNLNGKALAGVSGATNARIFCHKIQAELVAIGGLYKTLEEENYLTSHPKQIFIKDNELTIEYL